MIVVILAAGYGTRLLPLTLNKPKSLLLVKEKTILENILEKLPIELKKIIVSNEKFYLDFVWFISKNKFENVEIISTGSLDVADQKGGIHDLLFALDQKKIEDDIIVIYGDLLFDFYLQDFIDFFKNEGTCVGLYDLKKKERAYKYGVVQLDEKGNIIEIEEKPKEPKSSLVLAGIYGIKKEDIKELKEFDKRIREQNLYSPDINLSLFFKEICKDRKIRGFVFDGFWKDIGTIEDYEEVK